MNSALTDRRNPLLRADSVEELCAWRGMDFIRCAYVTILGRQPDPAGAAHYFDRLSSGMSKLGIISQMRRSSEGRRHDPGIRGLDKRLRQHRNASRPVFGPIVRLLTGRPGASASTGQIRVLSELMGAVENLTTRQKLTDQRIEHIANLAGEILTAGRAIKFDVEQLAAALNLTNARIEDSKSDLRGALAERMDNQESLLANASETLVAEILDAKRDLDLKTVVLGTKIEANHASINEVKFETQRVRGQMLKANQRY